VSSDEQQAPPKKKGRPKKDPNAPKATYNLSRAERARRALQARVRKAEKSKEKHQQKAQDKASYARKLKKSAKKVETALSETGSRVVDMDDVSNLPATVKEIIDDTPVIFKPNDGPQEEFLSAPEQDVLYGGAAGGGKSFALLADPLRYCHNANHRGLLLRRTLDELTELIDKSKQLYPKAFPGAIYREAKSTWVFPLGQPCGSPI